VKRVAIVTPWFGESPGGGAERQARELAARLSARGHVVEVLTTCSRSSSGDWSASQHAPGVEIEDAITVRRFAVDVRDARAFDDANAKLLALARDELKVGVSPVAEDVERNFVAHNLNSSALVGFLRDTGESFDAVLFLPYLYGTTLIGLPVVAARALLQPCLHDEPYAYLRAVAETFRAARRILFNSEGERELARQLYGPGIHTRSRLVGEGVEPARLDAQEIAGRRTNEQRIDRQQTDEQQIDESPTGAEMISDALPAELRGARFVLYLGRRDATKNVDLLARAFRRFKANHPASDLSLVLAGAGRESFHAPAEGIHDLGLIGEETKSALLCAARALFQPSRNESFSRALMEAWLAARPVAAHRRCLATALAVERARGGWLAATGAEWARAFAIVAAASDEELNQLGARGRAYAREHADWNKVIDRYEAVLSELEPARTTVGAGLVPAPSGTATHQDSSPHHVDETGRGFALTRDGQGQALPLQASTSPRAALRAIHQLLPDALHGDAITNHALSIRDYLRGAGFASEVFAKRREETLAREAQLFDGAEIDPSAGLIYHHSIGSEVTAAAIAHAGAKCLVYHNITPAEFFAPYRPGFAWLLEAGRASLRRLARHFPCSVGDSAFNAAELRACGFHAPGVLPIIVSPDRWNIAPDEALMRELQDGQTNLLFVGRVAPNKHQDALAAIFAGYVQLDARARLVVAGEGDDSDPYFRHVLRSVERLGLARRVVVTGRVTESALLAYYRTAHLYLSPSEHEGFGVPLVEAMWFDVPVLARRGTAVTETLADAGVLYDADESHARIAQLAHRLARTDEDLRRRVCLAQRRRRNAFTPAALRPVLENLLRRMETDCAPRSRVA
jgi:glycosyltransferase involved in cell wall biosynthesis